MPAGGFLTVAAPPGGGRTAGGLNVGAVAAGGVALVAGGVALAVGGVALAVG
ncbi:MAG: hypothetical protein JWO86_5533, partial [Myxococcaceae bacterium]|nr:hypothetical protein [Myxococcaceae bacterium]